MKDASSHKARLGTLPSCRLDVPAYLVVLHRGRVIVAAMPDGAPVSGDPIRGIVKRARQADRAVTRAQQAGAPPRGGALRLLEGSSGPLRDLADRALVELHLAGHALVRPALYVAQILDDQRCVD